MSRTYNRKNELIGRIRGALVLGGYDVRQAVHATATHRAKSIKDLKVELIGLRNILARNECTATADTTCNQTTNPKETAQ